MKKILLACLLAGVFSLNSQTHNCGEDNIVNIQKANLHNYEKVIEQVNLNLQKYIQNHFKGNTAGKSMSASTPTSYIIPVVFHVVHSNGHVYGVGSNISYAQIQSQLNALNAAFAKNYPSYNGQTHPSYAQNTTIQFCLAKVAQPSSVSFYNGPGGTEYGVMRYPDNTLTSHQMSNAGASALLGLTHPSAAHFPFANYLNIWVVSTIASGGAGTIMGYAPKPIMNSYPLDGVVMRSDIIGDNTTGNAFNLGYGLTQGKVLVHEVGHYLNLYHIFQNGCAGANAAGSATDACDLNGDFICDIEPVTTQNYNCSQPIPNTCSANYATGTTNMDMIESYMSYADDNCMSTFTSDQTIRMKATLNTLRSNLWATTNLAATGIIGTGGCLSPFLMSNILVSTNNICSGTAITLWNPQLGNTATSYTWSLAGGTPSSSNANSVSVTYTAPGLYWAKLKVSDGTIVLKDSVLMKVANCALDSTRMNRANWYFSDYSGINFNTIPATAITNPNMYKGYEGTVSMSDNKGNLLFYTNCINFWNKNHQQVNTTTPFLNLLPGNNGSSTPGVIAIPWPMDTSKYILISSPHTGNIYDSIYYAVYNVTTNTLGPKKGFIHPTLPTSFSEPLTVVPHCNGRDYWVICRPYYNIANSNRAYSILITPAGPGQIDKVVVSQGITPGTSGQFKTNRKGDRMIQADYTSGTLAKLYKFSKTTGVMSNEVTVNGGSGVSNGAVFSPNDSFAVVLRTAIDPVQIFHLNVFTLATQTLTVPTGNISHMMELGPDNNIYMTNSDYNGVSMAKIINSGSWNNIAYVPNGITFTWPAKPFHGVCNFMDADKGPEIANDYLLSAVNCNTYKFTVDSCWQVYTANWSFGDGTTGTGLTVNHTYTAGGAYSATLVLSVGNYSLSPVIKNFTILSNTTTIVGPSVMCIGSTFLNNYGVTTLSGASYSWTATNATISGMNTTPNINLGSSTAGTATLSVQIVNGGCTTNAVKTITVDPLPNVTLVPPTKAICFGDSLTLVANPPGGTLSGNGVIGNMFWSSISGTGVFPVNYFYTNTNGCSNSAAISVTVTQCTGIEELNAKAVSAIVAPNPTKDIFNISSDRSIRSVSVVNVLGQNILMEECNNCSNVIINLAGYEDGIYFVKIITDAGMVTKKVIKKE
jgi:hypothetical protein